jgi:hypothetical protein
MIVSVDRLRCSAAWTTPTQTRIRSDSRRASAQIFQLGRACLECVADRHPRITADIALCIVTLRSRCPVLAVLIVDRFVDRAIGAKGAIRATSGTAS